MHTNTGSVTTAKHSLDSYVILHRRHKVFWCLQANPGFITAGGFVTVAKQCRKAVVVRQLIVARNQTKSNTDR